jgi:CelD/BcsL family acetyltransferase involved in cellulose biosynthesis
VQLELLDPFSTQAEQIWRDLEEATPRSFFVSWPWIENWLACIPRELDTRVAVLREAERPMAAFCLVRRTVARLPMLGSRALYFNATGIPRFDSVYIEYNGLVGRDLWIGRLVDAMPDDWDELFLPGLRADAFGGLVETVIRGFRVRLERTVPVHYVDLARVRSNGYLKLLGSQTRSQIRRAQREAGELTVEVATDVETALSIYRELVALHQKQWHARGQPGAFADPWFDRFHRRLIAHRFRHGEIQLVRVRSKLGTLGTLYNFVYRGRVLQYQSGMAQLANPHLKPGYLSHAVAIEHAATTGLDAYDFLAGDRRYKRSLSTDHTSLLWARVQRPRLRFLLEDRLRGWARARRPVATGSVAT